MMALPFILGGYVAISADPPWSYDAGRATRIGPTYPTMTVDEIARMPVAACAADRALLALWTTAAFDEAAHHVARAWGFEPKSQVIWVKGRVDERRGLVLHPGMGSYVLAHEPCLICTRGGLTAAARNIPSVILAPRGRHSAKPEALQDAVERMVPQGPYLDLFARRIRPGWTCWGNEVTP